MKRDKCFAVRGETMIDTINPETGLSDCFGKDLAKVRQEYPTAEVMDIGEYCRSKAEKQDAGGEWREVTEAKFDEMLNVLPPAAFVRGFSHFMVGEPWDHHALTGQPRFSAYKFTGGKYFEFSRPMTFREFKQIAGETARYQYVS